MSTDSQTASAAKFKYRPEVDGLRAVAVIPVVLFHADMIFSGGYVGVDVFFVISGYLITSLLIRDLEGRKFSLANFWERRVRRIVPALAAVILPVMLAGYFILLPEDLVELGESVAAQSVILANVYFWRETGYFAGPADLKPLLHTWSLAVEEQFYVFFPILLAILYRFRKWIGTAFVLGLIASFVMNVYLIERSPSATFFLLPTRAWELLVGAIIAKYATTSEKLSRSASEVGSAVGLCLILFSMLTYTKSTPFPGWAAVLPVLGSAAFIYCSASQKTWAAKLLSTTPFVFVGLISYSLYLWHWPVFAYLRYMVNDVTSTIFIGAILLSFLLATLSYYFVEQPFRKKQLLASPKSIFQAATVYLTGIFLCGAAASYLAGWPNRFDPKFEEFIADAKHTGNEYQTTLNYLNANGFRVIGNTSSDQFDFLLAGDSHAMVTVDVLDELAKKHDLKGAIATNNTTVPLLGVWSSRKEKSGKQTNAWNEKVMELAQTKQIKNVVLVAAWSCYFNGWTKERIAAEPELANDRGYATDDPAAEPTQTEAARALGNALERTLKEYSNANMRVWILPQAPEATEQLVAQRFLTWKLYPALNRTLNQNGRSLDSYQERSSAEWKVFERYQALGLVKILDHRQSFFAGEDAVKHYGDHAHYKDIGHLTKSGAQSLLRPCIFESDDSRPSLMSEDRKLNKFIAKAATGTFVLRMFYTGSALGKHFFADPLVGCRRS